MFESVKSNKISEHIIEQIRKSISEDHLKPGGRLPSGRELTESSGVSKATLRSPKKTLPGSIRKGNMEKG